MLRSPVDSRARLRRHQDRRRGLQPGRDQARLGHGGQRRRARRPGQFRPGRAGRPGPAGQRGTRRLAWPPSASRPSGSRSRTGSTWPPPSAAGVTSRSAGSCAPLSRGAAIRMATDAKAAAQAEVRWGALAGCDPGRLPEPGHRAVHRPGHRRPGRARARTARPARSAITSAPSSDVGLPLGARVPLEDMISGQALARRAPRSMAAADVFGAAAGEPGLDRLVSDFVTELAFHVVNLAIVREPGPDRGGRRHWSTPGSGCGRAWSRRSRRAPRSRPSWWPPASRRRAADRRGGPGRGRGRGGRPFHDPATRAAAPARHDRSRHHQSMAPPAGAAQPDTTQSDTAQTDTARTHRSDGRLGAMRRLGNSALLITRRASWTAGFGGPRHGRRAAAAAPARAAQRRTARPSPTRTAPSGPATSARSTASDTLLSVGFVYEPLVYVNPLQSGKTTPMLATSWKWGAATSRSRSPSARASSSATAPRSPPTTWCTPSTC